MPPRIPDDKRAEILADIKAGKARNQIARDHHVSAGTVTNIAAEGEVTGAFDRSATKSATAAAEADSRSRRADLASLNLGDAMEMRQRALDSQTSRDAMQYATAYGIFIDKHLVLDRHDADGEQGMAAVDQWLRSIVGT